MEELRRLPAAQSLHGMELLHLLELRQLVMLTQPGLDGLVMVILWRDGHEVEDAAQAFLGEKVH